MIEIQIGWIVTPILNRMDIDTNTNRIYSNMSKNVVDNITRNKMDGS